MVREVGIVVDQLERPGAGALHEVEVIGQSSELQVGHPRLLRVEQGALASRSRRSSSASSNPSVVRVIASMRARASRFVSSDSSNRTQ